MNKHLKKLISYISLLSIMLYSCPLYALTKDETVYAKLNSNGEVKTNIVNNHIKNTEKLDILEDETDLLNILNINGNETYKIDNNKLTWNSQGNDIFYQGTSSKPLPITIDIKYYLNDEEKDIQTLIGAKGKITIKLNFTNNEEHIVNILGKDETLYTPFVITTGLILKGKTNENITVTNGKVIENGKDYLIGAISSPNLSKSLNMEELKSLDEIKIDFETTSFELPNIYIIATPKVFNEEDLKIFDKMDELYNNVYKLKTTIDEIETGSDTLLKGAQEIKDGNNQIHETLKLVSSKVNELNLGAYEINKGVESLIQNLNSLNLPQNFNPNSIPDLINANNLAIETLENLNTNNNYDQVIYALKEENKLLNSLTFDILPALSKLSSQKESITKLYDGTKKLYDGTSSLKEGLELLTNSTKDLRDGTNNLYEGLNTLNLGINRFNNEGITKINNYLNGNIKTTQTKIKELVNLSNEYTTFSKSNKEMTSKTKFVITIDGINVPKEKKLTKQETKNNKNLWQKFIDLFR